ncbi:MAG: peptide-methionine (S)-S-oxide reductase MsrA [Alphaproteobacteria bacterium]|nr:peptide-methionine (S)-S-oxide reductase MsrA [Alphaproteobacteria bacterium]
MNGLRPVQILTPETALRGRENAIPTAETHYINGRPLANARPDGTQSVLFGLGCFWGAERLLWQLDGVWVTSVGYAGGLTPNPTYEETCTGQTGHTEVVEVVYQRAIISFESLLKTFWEGHDPTQGMRQGGDMGSQYRSAIYTRNDAQLAAALASKTAYGARLKQAGLGPVTTEIGEAGVYYMAEDYHQQYLAKNPSGYCGIGGTGVRCPGAPGA